MLEDAEQERKALDTLPQGVRSLLDDLDVLLANNQRAAGRSTLAALGAEITLAPNDTGPIVHVLG
jgi:hypothetical protein